ncbi:hypothetical protein C7M61_003533 [Candidozyma pseudohaemuli]|uniref:Uncharacterized protein n=1 Tax=Candidozyma pseudohaemuli TaxID=418784 RepID=A0A2P7YMA4_9ASCO|nr:hypothetical protein C7M61_003533 [[Candida] pseudohaemulonii]PSK37106.1 hypothetical protein C7M61_003533 [[Candida] pseudohaemulonii]
MLGFVGFLDGSCHAQVESPVESGAPSTLNAPRDLSGLPLLTESFALPYSHETSQHAYDKSKHASYAPNFDSKHLRHNHDNNNFSLLFQKYSEGQHSLSNYPQPATAQV